MVKWSGCDPVPIICIFFRAYNDYSEFADAKFTLHYHFVAQQTESDDLVNGVIQQFFEWHSTQKRGGLRSISIYFTFR